MMKRILSTSLAARSLAKGALRLQCAQNVALINSAACSNSRMMPSLLAAPQRRLGHGHSHHHHSHEAAGPVELVGIDIASELAYGRDLLAKTTDDYQRAALQTHIKILEKIDHAKNTAAPIEFDTKESVLTSIVQVLRTHAKVVDGVRITPATHIMKDLGLDSLDFAEVMMEVENAFIMQIPDEQAFKLQTVADIYNFVLHYEYANIKHVTATHDGVPLPDAGHH